MLTAGCATPGTPRPPERQVPEPVTDLRVHQSGNTLVLHFTVPDLSTDGRKLSGAPRVEIFRLVEFAPATPSAPPTTAEPATPAAGAPSGHLTRTLSGPALARDMAGDTVTIDDVFSSTDFAAMEQKTVSYRVRIAAGNGPWSALSNRASLQVVVAPAAPEGLTAELSGDSVDLRWRVAAPGRAPAPSSFIVYRTRLLADGSAAAPARAVGVTTGNSYQDRAPASGDFYRYAVRGVVTMAGVQVESADSTPVVVHASPAPVLAAPRGLVAIPVRSAEGHVEVELSWEIGSQPNLAGYNVYRTESPSIPGLLVNSRVLLAPAFRDTTVRPGRTYYYSVAAVGFDGSESRLSAPVKVTMPLSAGSPR